MNPLLKRLAFLRKQVRLLDGVLGISAIVALVVGVFLFVGLVDFWLHIPSLIRASLLVGLIIGSVLVAYRYLIYPFSKPCDDLNLALRIEEIYPELNDSLATTVQFLNQSPEDQVRVGGSPAMREKTVQATAEKAAGYDFGRILDRRAAGIFVAAAVCVLLTTGLVAGMNRAYASIAFWRFVEPFGMHTWTRIAVYRETPADFVDAQDEESKWRQIDAKEPDKVAKGQRYLIRVKLEGQMPRKGEAKVEVRGKATKIDQMIPLAISADGLSAEFTKPIDMTLQYETFKFRIVANDGSFPPRGDWHEVEVVKEPKLVAPALVTIFPPKYTELPQPKPQEGPGLVEVYAGSTVVLRAKADRKLREAWIEYVPQPPEVLLGQQQKQVRDAVQMILGPIDPMHTLVQAAGGNAVWGRVPAVFDPDGATFTVTFMPWVTGKYVLHLRDFDRLSCQVSTDLNVLVDPAPEVKLHVPTATTVTRLPDGDVPFKFTVTDDHFAIRSVYVEYRRKIPATGQFEEPVRTVIYTDAAFAKLVPELSARMARAPFSKAHPALGAFPMNVPDLRMRHKKLEVDLVWALQNRFREGDMVVIEVCADDFCDVYPSREPGRSNPIELRIVSRRVIFEDSDREMADILKQLKKAARTEEKALDAVKETQKHDQSDQKLVDSFVENAESPQRQVQEMIGKESTDALRKKVRDLRKMLEENKLTSTKTYRDSKMIQGVIDGLAMKELTQIDPKIAQAREDLTKLEKISPMTRKKLADTAKLQDRVVKALHELIKELEPQAKINEIAEKIRNVNQKSAELAKELEKLNAEKQAHDKNPNNTEEERKILEKAQKEALDRIAKEQNALANQMEKILQEMKDARNDYKDDKANLDKLNQALKQAGQPEEQKKIEPPKKETPKKEPPKEPPPVNAQMRELAKKLESDNEVKNMTLQQQKDIAKQLEKVVEAIEGRNDDGLKEQIAQREEVNKKIDAHKEKLDRLREEVKKADMIKDKEERLKKKQELAEQHARLQEEIEKTRRELERLNEKDAAAKLQDAADKLEQAARNLQNDANPEPQQEDARKDLNKAKQEIKDHQEDLVRELLVKMADQLEGLKIREVASLERTESLHEKIMKRKSWTEAFLGTIEGNMDAQKTIAEETDTFKDKLKDAKVFHSLLEKAKSSMDGASETMKSRHEKGNDRRYLEMDGDKKFMDADELGDEKEVQATTVRHQKQAVKRLETLLDSIKEEIRQMDKKKERREQNPPDNDGNEPKEKEGGFKAQDGIPHNAQLKALRAEQLDLLERTKAFDARKLDPNNLTEAQQKELKELTDDQENIHTLFRELMRAVEQAQQPQQPEPKEKKEGAPK